MKIIIDREDLEHILSELETNPDITKACERAINALDTILEEHPHKTDGVIGVEIDEWPTYAPEDYENINRKMIVNILTLLTKIHYEIDYKEMRAMAQKLLLQLAEQPHEDIS